MLSLFYKERDISTKTKGITRLKDPDYSHRSTVSDILELSRRSISWHERATVNYAASRLLQSLVLAPKESRRLSSSDVISTSSIRTSSKKRLEALGPRMTINCGRLRNHMHANAWNGLARGCVQGHLFFFFFLKKKQ